MLKYIYYITLVLAVLVGIASYKIKNKKLFFVSLAPMIYIAMFRFSQGIDYFSYQFIYVTQRVDTFYNMLANQVRFEPGFRSLIYVFRNLDLSPHVFIATLSIVILAFVSLWIYENSDYPTISLAVFYGFFYLVWVLSALRQGVVIGVGTYFLISKNRKLNTMSEISLVLLLTTIHFSAVFFFLIIILRHIKLSKKSLIIILIISVISTFVPFGKIFEVFSFLPYTTRLIPYFKVVPGILNFPGLVRLSFSIYLIYLIYTYSWEDYEYNLIQNSLIGFSIYFVLKFSEVWAGRLVMYTFIYMVLIFAMHLKKINKKPMAVLFLVGIMSFSALYFQKDALSMQELTGNLTVNKLLEFKSIQSATYSDYQSYDNPYAFLLYNTDKQQKNKQQFFENFKPSVVPHVKGGNYIAVYNHTNSCFGVLNQDGNWVHKDVFCEKITIKSDVAQIQISPTLDTFKFYDIFELGLSHDQMTEESLQYTKEELEIRQDLPEFEEITDYSTYENQLKEIFPSTKYVEKITKISFKLPFKYSVLQINYFDSVFFVYLNEEGELLIKDPIMAYKRYNSDGYLETDSFGQAMIYNSQGEVIWFK